jgi:hypothetical protein
MRVPLPDPTIGALIVGITEFAKIYIEDKIEHKVIPPIAILAGAILGYFYADVVTGVLTAMVSCGLYKVAMKGAGKLGGK